MAGQYRVYQIGTPGTPWGEAERAQWRAAQPKQRDYFTEVASKVTRVGSNDETEIIVYGHADYRCFGSAQFPLFALRTGSKAWDPALPLAVVTGGVHGYETSGVQGAILFAQTKMREYAARPNRANLLVLPCISPWGYEHIQRWNPLAIDPNRCFNPNAPGCIEAELAMKCIAEHAARSTGFLLHVDLHETTDTDNSEFRPALIARDGVQKPYSEIPDGYYSVANQHFPCEDYHKFVLDAVAKVTPIAPSDADGNLIGEKQTLPGCIHIDGKQWGICGALTGHFPNTSSNGKLPDYAYSLTTEIYPDMRDKKTGERIVTDDECNRAQLVVVTASLDFALAKLQ